MKTAARLFASVALLFAATAPASVTLNLKDADIATLIATVSEVTGKNFIVDTRVKGKVTVISSKPMSAAGVYETFLGVLQVNGFAVIPDGQAYKIVPEANAKQDGGVRTHSGRGLPIDDVVTYVHTPQNVSAPQLVPILRALMPQWAHLAAYAPGNQLIISDRAANVQRMIELIDRMDQSSDRSVDIVKLDNASAAEVVRTLTALTSADKAQDPTIKPAAVIADERSNSVLIGGDKAERVRLLSLIKQLDLPLDQGGSTQVVYLRYASAENLAPILEGYAQQVNKAGAAGGAAPAGGSAPAVGGGNTDARVLADKDTNALIITAPPKAMRQLRDVIAQLDIQRAQVLVEAVIAEVSASKQSQLGVDWVVFNRDRIAAAGLYSIDPSSIAQAAASGGGSAAAALGLLGRGANIAGGVDGGDTGTSFAILLKALQGDGDTNILSTPTLVTVDNQEAKFSAGQEVPFLTGQFSNTGVTSPTGVVNPFQTIERKDVGLTLGVTPQVNVGDSIKLKIDLEVSSLASGVAGGANLITNKRELTNTVNVESGQILVIGGLIDDQLTDSQSGFPLLGKIPLIGVLFSSRTVTKTKRNLMVFIKPTVLRSQSDGDYYTRKKYDAVRQAQQEASFSGPLPMAGNKKPLLVPMEELNQDRPPKALKDAPAVVTEPSPEPEPQSAPAPEPERTADEAAAGPATGADRATATKAAQDGELPDDEPEAKPVAADRTQSLAP
jgi:general secretion pathway protein D